MKPSDKIFRGMESIPGWMVTLVRQLDGGGRQPPAETLSPVTMLDELLAVTGAMIRGRKAPYPADRKSLRTDVQRSFDDLGPASRTLHATAIGDFRKQAARIDTLLNDLADAHVLRADAEVLLRELTSITSRMAAFDDCVEAFRDGASAGVCEKRLRYLRTVVEAAGHDWTERARRLHDALAGSYQALQAHGALNPPDRVGVYLEDAGLSVEERLSLSHVILRADPPQGRVIVWLAYADAFIQGFHLAKGPVEFYDSRIWSAVTDGQWPGNPGWTQPPELSDPSASLFLRHMPPDNFVMVRVTLDNTPIAKARRRGRDLARAALELTGWISDWVLMDGEAVYVDDWFGTMGFTDPRETALRGAGSPMLDPAAQELAKLGDELLRRIAAGERDAAELIADIRWRRAVAGLPDVEHRVSLLVALFERVLVPSSLETDKWHGSCKRYFQLLLALDDVQQQIWDAGYYGVQSLRRLPTGQTESVDFQRAIIESTGQHSFRVHLDEVIRSASDLRQHVEPDSIELRLLEEVERRTADGAAALEWLRQADDRFDRLLDRARRQRNALTHGTRTVPAVLESVEPFLNKLAGRLIGAFHRCVDEGLDLTTELQRFRLIQLQKRDALAAGGAPDKLLV